jgi:phosphate transport system substrate-binding protein
VGAGSPGQDHRWNQVNPAWPDAPIKLFGAGADSGTFDYFTEAIVGKAKSSRGDYTASEDDNVLVQGVSRTSMPSATSATPTTPRTRPS